MAKRMPRHIRNQLYAKMLKEGKGSEEIAAEMGLTVNYVKSQIQRFRESGEGQDNSGKKIQKKPKPEIEVLGVQSYTRPPSWQKSMEYGRSHRSNLHP